MYIYMRIMQYADIYMYNMYTYIHIEMYVFICMYITAYLFFIKIEK